MAIWMSFKGVRNTSLGLRLTELPNRFKPAVRGNRIVIPGRDGDLWLPDGGYENIKLLVGFKMVGVAAEGGANGNASIDWSTISEWLNGSGDLVFSDDSDHCYRARVISQYEYQRQLPYRKDQRRDDFTIIFDCQPFRYLSAPNTYLFTSHGSIVNSSVIPAQPLIEVNGSGNITLLIGTNTLYIANLPGKIFIDAEARYAYNASGVLVTQSITGDWPELNNGANSMSWSGSVSSVQIQPNFRWL